MRIFTSLLIVIALVFIGCGGSKQVVRDESGMPAFVLNPPRAPGKLYGSGIAKKASPQLAKEIADLNAKKEIAKVLGQQVSNLMKQFMGESGIGEAAEVTEFSQSITKAVTDQNLVGVIVEKREFVGGTMYSLAMLDLTDSEVMGFIKNQVERALTSKEALLSEFRAKKGFEELEKELQKLNVAQ